METLKFVKVTGGSGASALSMMCALKLSEKGRTLWVTDPWVGNAFADCMPGESPLDVRSTDDEIGDDYDFVVVDGWTFPNPWPDPFVVGMIRNDYLSLKRCIVGEWHDTVDMYVGLVADDRSLTLKDCQSVLKPKTLVGWTHNPAIARALDAGLVARAAWKSNEIVSQVLKHMEERNAMLADPLKNTVAMLDLGYRTTKGKI